MLRDLDKNLDELIKVYVASVISIGLFEHVVDFFIGGLDPQVLRKE